GELSQAQSAVAGGHQAVPIDTEAILAQSGASLGGQQSIEENSSAQNDRLDPGYFPQPATHGSDQLDNGRMESPCNQGRLDSSCRLCRHGPDQWTCIDDEG